MDPDENQKRQIVLAQRILKRWDADELTDPDAAELAQMVVDLSAHWERGGALPTAIQKAAESAARRRSAKPRAIGGVRVLSGQLPLPLELRIAA